MTIRSGDWKFIEGKGNITSPAVRYLDVLEFGKHTTHELVENAPTFGGFNITGFCAATKDDAFAIR